MRKAVIGLVVLFCLAGVASALPTLAQGGTIYLNYTCQNNDGSTGAGAAQILKYVDIGSNWLPTGSPGSKVQTVTTLTGDIQDQFGNKDNGQGCNIGAGTISSWSGPTQTTSHSADVLMMAGGKLYSVSVANPSGTVLNAAGSPTNWTIAVNSNFTPSNQARGAFNGASTAPKLYTETVPGNNVATVSTTAGAFVSLNSYAAGPAYSTIKPGSLGTYYIVDSNSVQHPVDGVTWVADSGVSGTWNSKAYAVYHKTDDSGYISVSMDEPTSGYSFNTGNAKTNGAVAVGDTNGDGIPDFYYIGGVVGDNGTQGRIYHGEDVNNDGDISDNVETREFGLSFGLSSQEGKRTIQLVQGTDGKWALLMFRTGQGSTGGYNINPLLQIVGLDDGGQYDTAGITTILSSTESSFATPYDTVGNGYVSYGQPGIAFVQTQAPEPATLMLVGTGVLGLAGVIRRRLIG